MNDKIDSHENNPDRETPQAETVCGSGCDCDSRAISGRNRGFIGIIILVVAGALVARAVIKSNHTDVDQQASGFAIAAATDETAQQDGGGAVADEPGKLDSQTSIGGTEIATLADLNRLATDIDAVFVYLPSQADGSAGKAPMDLLNDAVKTIKTRGTRVGVFTLKTDAPEYPQLAAQMSVPGVIVMVKGRGMVPVTGDITEDKLIQAFVAASNAGGCGPSGCGPSGCP